VNKHIKKCFDNINKLKFDEEVDNKVLSIISKDPEKEPEVINFIEP